MSTEETILEKLNLHELDIKDIRPHRKRAYYRSSLQWLQSDAAKPTAYKYEDVKGYLEVFFNFAAIHDWPRAKKIFYLRIDPRTSH
ncbi:hypothetical protein [Adonisia turfae]|uniref:hypothetical protein n=1 Tax=Adonisia turfae TaxID=2950184 RepID=UPI0013D08E50|nr:hypothetical protein [Adonisia turfae]